MVVKCIKDMTKWIFNRNGRAAALDGGDAVYDSHGNLCFWVYGNNLYNRDGDHVGWTEGGVYYDSDNDVIGFVRDHTQDLPSNPGIGGTPGILLFLHRPGRPGFSGIPGRPGYGGWSDTLLEDYIEDNG